MHFLLRFRQTLSAGKLKRVKKEKNKTKFSKDERFYAFFRNFRRTLWTGILERVNKDGLYCPVGFSEKYTAVFFVKMTQIDTENDKKTKSFPIFKVFL